MSNIEPNIIDPTKGPPMPPDSLPGGDHVGDDAIREPETDVPPVEPDPEERPGPGPDDVERAG